MPRPLSEWIDELLPERNLPRAVVFRVDAGRVDGLSFGHLERCLIMARVLKKRGIQCRFVMRPIPDGPERAEASGFEVHGLGEELSESVEWDLVECLLRDSGSGCLIVDLPYADLDFSRISKINRTASPVIYVDDARFEIPEVSAYLNSSILASEMIDDPSAEKTRVFLGPERLILDESFFECRRFAGEDDGSIVLTFGGSDPTDLLPRVLQELSTMDVNGTRFKCILGPGYKKDLSGMPCLGDEAFEFIRCPDDLISIFAHCRAAICAGGRTMYELWALGKLFLPIGTAEHEAQAIAVFKKTGLCHLGLEAWNKTAFRAQMERLMVWSDAGRNGERIWQ